MTKNVSGIPAKHVLSDAAGGVEGAGVSSSETETALAVSAVTEMGR
jgi:hypothetical protein